MQECERIIIAMDTQMTVEIMEVEPDSRLTQQIKNLLNRAFEGDFSTEDWEHTLGGVRFLGWIDGDLVAHGAISTRNIWLNELPTQIGYVEAIAVEPEHWGRGYGAQLMEKLSEKALDLYQISMLSTDEKGFYKRIGWMDFQGESFVKIGTEEIRTADEDAGLMLLSRDLKGLEKIVKAVCESRSGDAW